MLSRFGNSTIFEQSIDNLLNSRVDEVIVVVGHRAEEMISLATSRPVSVVVNPAYREGMSTSLVAGLSVVSHRAQGVMLSLADQPLVDSQTINRLIEAFTANANGIVIPVYQGRRGHPVIFAISYRVELLRLEGDIGGRKIIGRHPDDILEVTVDCEGICIDIDTDEQLQLLQRNMSK